jgi:glycerophosphoryl diester phosphodiesterase
MPATSDESPKRTIHLIHHAANDHHNAPAGSLAALERCLAAGAAFIEIDVLPLGDGSFALLHDRDLSVQTGGTGDALQSSRQLVENLTYKVKGNISAEKVGFLEDAVSLLQDYSQTERLQLDLKPYLPLTGTVLQDFITLLQPVLERVQVTTIADWIVRRLHRAIPELALGFDPLLYIDLVEDDPRPEGVPPFRTGAYGLLDDHPLSTYRWGSSGQYFAARAEGLWTQAQSAGEWYIRAEVLEMAQKAGFDWIGFLHDRGCTVDAWTIDVEQPDLVRTAKYLVEQGVDELTTDTPEGLAEHLSINTVY